MLFSIIIPIYNVELYLDECLESLEGLSSSDIEIIAINDGSIDSSPDILDKWTHKIHNLVIINQTNRGLSGARNTGLSICKGDYIAFIDSDDYVDSSALLKLFESAKHSKADITIGDYYEFIQGNGQNNLVSLKSNRSITNGETFFLEYFKPLKSMVWRSVYRRSFLLDNNISFKEGIYFEDILFTPSVFLRAKKILNTNIPFYYYRKRANSITTSISSSKKIGDTLLIWHLLKGICNELKVSSNVTNIISSICFHLFLLQYYSYNTQISNELWIKVKNLANTKFHSNKYKLISNFLRFTSQSLFRTFTRFIIYNHLK